MSRVAYLTLMLYASLRGAIIGVFVGLVLVILLNGGVVGTGLMIGGFFAGNTYKKGEFPIFILITAIPIACFFMIGENGLAFALATGLLFGWGDALLKGAAKAVFKSYGHQTTPTP